MRTLRPLVVFLLSCVGAGLAAGCGADAPPDRAGRWTSRPARHGESAEAVEWFGADAVERLHAAGNAATPPVELDLARDGTFVLTGELVPGGPSGATARGAWRPAGGGVRLEVRTEEDATGLASVLVVRADGVALVFRRGPDEEDDVLLFRDAP
ncbi:MAG: hypothetical protein U1E39_09735 [Planctomycetota bacterium]